MIGVVLFCLLGKVLSVLGIQYFTTICSFDKPSKNTSIVTSCKIGGRASRASSTLIDLGYTNVKVYGGSLKDWKENDGPVE